MAPSATRLAHTPSTKAANGFSTPPTSPGSVIHNKFDTAYGNSRPPSGHYGNSMNRSFAWTARSGQSNDGYKIGFVQEAAVSLKKKSISELGVGVSQSVANVSFINLIESIRDERLATLPHKGSRWDKVLIRAQYFAEKLHHFDVAIQSFALDSHAAAELGYGHARLLLELGHDNSEALDKAFSFFYKNSLVVSALLERTELLSVTSETREELCKMYTDLLSLVVDVAIRFYKAVHGMLSSSVSLDMFEVFGDTIESLRSRQATVTEAIWSYQIENEGLDPSEVLDVKIISRWLSPEDRVLSSLGRDHTTFADHQAELTCLWFQKPLSKFLQSNTNYLLLTGQPGSGKTALAASIAERLQRPLGKKSFSSLFVSISSGIPTQANSISVVKSILIQLLSLRTGNMAMYYALAHAYDLCNNSADDEVYENHLWQALADILKNPLDKANDLIIIVDGLDEVEGGNKASQALFDKLLTVIEQGKRVKLVTSSQPKSVVASANHKGIEHAISHDDIHDDIYAVAIKALIRNHHFHKKSGPEQEEFLNRVIQHSNGSFLWTVLVCQLLNLEKTPESFSKTWEAFETTHPSVQDVTLKVITVLDPTNDAKTILSWIAAAERPFTLQEIEILFSIDTQKGTIARKHVDIHDIIESLKPILSIHDDIIRFRHPIIQHTLQTAIKQGKIPSPIKDSQLDLVLRTLIYTKSTLVERREPIFDPVDQTLADRLFHQHHFLEYAIRYWVLHLKHAGLVPKPTGDFTVITDVQKNLPDSTTAPILEKLCWDAQFPGAQEVQLHSLVGRIRSKVFTEDHPTVLQTYLSCATYYHQLSNTTETEKYYYLCTKISRTVLSDFHPLTAECANTYLSITETLTSTSRTEVMTHREQVLLILISAYERQFGATSEIVIRTRTTLAEFYVYIHEEERARELYKIIQEATVKHYGKNSHEAHGVSEKLNIVLGKKDEQVLETYNDSLFGEDTEEDVVEEFNLGQIAIILSRAEREISKKEFTLAERTYVELWQRVSALCRTTRSIEWHSKNIEIAQAYSSFLKTQKRETERSAVLAAVWEQYEHHELSFSDSIMTQLVQVAETLKSEGYYTYALAIFKRASFYYKSVRKEESHSYSEIEKQITQTSTEIIKQTVTSSSTTNVSESVFESVFQSAITSSKEIDITTISLAKKLTAQYIEQRKWSEAITVIKSTLQRTWASFFSESSHDITITSTFLQESIYLVEQLAEVYIRQRQLEKVEDVYLRLFRAVLRSPQIDATLFEKAKQYLLTFYDKHGYVDSAISVYQEILVVYRTTLGPSHEKTIQVLYTLASRCRAHPRNHPYWIEYYQQIVTGLNKNSEISHKDATDAIIIVSDSYWEDRRFAEALTVFGVLWATFIQKSKEYKQFSDTTFVQRLYERYTQSLEETRAKYEVLYKVSKEYHETSIKSYGAESSIAVEATLSLARVAQRSESHTSEAISLYEKASSSSASSSVSITEIKQTLSSLYVHQISSQSSSTVTTESIERATSIQLEQYVEARSKYGYSHGTSLTHLRELTSLYVKQKKVDLAIKELSIAIVEINTKETSSQKLIEAATSIASTYQALSLVERATEIVEELHRQIIAKNAVNSSKFSFDLTKTTRSSLIFLATLEYYIRKDLSITFSEIYASIVTEAVLFEEFRQALQAKVGMRKLLLVAAPLRSFLVQRRRTGLTNLVDEEVVNLFVQKETSKLGLLSKESPHIFIVAILEHLGHKHQDFNRAVIFGTNEQVALLTNAKKFPEAQDVAHLGFLFAVNHKAYSGPNAISYGFKLASLLVGRDGEKSPDATLRKKMLQLSNRIVKKILEICKSNKINFAQVQLPELSKLSALLGEQQDYETLEWLLSTLWSTRDAQRSWPAAVLLQLGRRLICARYLAGHPIKAIRLCEDIAYNMRRVHGARHPATLDTYLLLSELYTSTGAFYQSKTATDKAAAQLARDYFKKALLIHEDLLRLLVHEDGAGDGYDSDDELDSAAAILAEHGVSVKGSVAGGAAGAQEDDNTPALSETEKAFLAKRHLVLLKLAFQRLGGWPKAAGEYERLNAEAFRVFGASAEWKGLEGVEKWSTKGFGGGKAESEAGVFKEQGVGSWEFAAGEVPRALTTVTQVKHNGTNKAVVEQEEEEL
ncbi:NACHT domain-containing protein [Mytilinidion resinicola]|uniref:NACHT domain-containing protein n=1 Tax=Mytilinidion resinicola TaxID=574789 RepID=A0A6A6YTW2_9PEZI|nr:NACHT domain-containing protein [Mytilinidion resinicola]KAF2812396.1 NACHT domain-containing protein [Mytilinidion resinicola]